MLFQNLFLYQYALLLYYKVYFVFFPKYNPGFQNILTQDAAIL